jgi:hypothetical protein
VVIASADKTKTPNSENYWEFFLFILACYILISYFCCRNYFYNFVTFYKQITYKKLTQQLIMNEGAIKGDSEASEIQKFIISMNDQLNYYTQNVNALSKIKERLISEPAVENPAELIKDGGSDIMSKLINIRYMIEESNGKFESLIIKLNKLV